MRRALPLLALTFAAGCQVDTATPPKQSVSTEPMSVDPAMQLREWPRTEYVFANGGVRDGRDWEYLEPKPDLPWWGYYAVEPGLYAVNTVLIPFNKALQPDVQDAEGEGVLYEPSYHGMPPLPPSKEPQATVVAPNAEPAVPAYDPVIVIPGEVPTTDPTEMTEPLPTVTPPTTQPETYEGMEAAPATQPAADDEQPVIIPPADGM